MRSALTLIAELKLVGKYSLKCKRELWHVQYIQSCIRNAARELLTLDEKNHYDLLGEVQNKLNCVLAVTVENCLQTIVFKNGMAMSLDMSVACLGNAASDLYINNDSKAIIEQTERMDNKAINFENC
ncbi:unnamed protein product [Urochloa humidicola]